MARGADGPRGRVEERMKPHQPTRLLAEARESFSMAMNALAAHKLRSALTLLGVLIGVFSIIVVMTAMRALKSNIEREIEPVGRPDVRRPEMAGRLVSAVRNDWEKYWRRKNITLAHGRQVQEKATLAGSVGIEGNFWGGQVETRYQKTPPDVQLLGETPGSFPARNWVVAEGRALTELDVDNARDVCVLGDGLAETVFPFGSAVGERLKINGDQLHRRRRARAQGRRRRRRAGQFRGRSRSPPRSTGSAADCAA